MKDPYSGNLDRIQIVKGWVNKGGKTEEKVYDVVWSGDRKPGIYQAFLLLLLPANSIGQ